jgi:enolase
LTGTRFDKSGSYLAVHSSFSIFLYLLVFLSIKSLTKKSIYAIYTPNSVGDPNLLEGDNMSIKTSSQKVRKRIALNKGWVIANHILVSFHVAFISSILSIPGYIESKTEVLKFMFVSYETIISLIFWYITFHTGIAWHEMGHYLSAIRLSALNTALLPSAQKRIEANFIKRISWYLWIFILIPFGKLKGVRRTGLEYHPDAPYNLAVAAAGPLASQKLALIAFPIAIILLTIGLIYEVRVSVYIGRLFLGMGAVGLLDFLLADPGKYREFIQRESAAARASKKATLDSSDSSKKWSGRVKKIKDIMIKSRMQKVKLPDGREEWIPWEFRNCGMGGRHTEKEFPESNISLQESMFVPLSAKDYEDAQEMTVNLQTRLKEIIETEEGCTVKGTGTEGGIAPYVKKEEGDIIPVQRLWRMQKRAIMDCGYIPGKDVVIALDPAASELEKAYRKTTGVEDEIGTYQAWRDENEPILSRDDLLEIYRKAIEDDDLPIISVEDGFAEDDDEGWRLIMEKLGDKIHVIGDDNITTKDSSIEEKAEKGLINAALIKLNQIGTVTEGVLAILTAIGKGLQTVVSHRSKSPMEDFEAQVALASNSLGLKAGGGSNPERLYKYESVVKVVRQAIEKIEKEKEGSIVPEERIEKLTNECVDNLSITEVIAREAPTNAGLPTVAVEVKVGVPGSDDFGKLLTFEGSTPLGTSAGTDEAIHLIDSIIPPKSPTVEKFPDLFTMKDDKTFRFKKEVKDSVVKLKNDSTLTEVWRRSHRYGGKGCLNAVDNITERIADAFRGKKISELKEIVDLDRILLEHERDTAIERGTLHTDSTKEEQILAMQRKANLGMNAILSLSLALARLKGAVKGKELCEVIGEEMISTIAKVFAANKGKEHLDTLQKRILAQKTEQAKFKKFAEKEIQQGVEVSFEDIVLSEEEVKSISEDVEKRFMNIRSDLEKRKKDDWKIYSKELSLDDLSIALRIIDEHRSKDRPLYQLLREQLPLY